MSSSQDESAMVKESLETQQRWRNESKESRLALVECALGLAKISSTLPLAFNLIAITAACLKMIHQWQLNQVRRVGHQHNSAHTFHFHLKTISLLTALLILDVLAMCSIFFFLLEFVWNPAQLQARYVGIASDVTILAISLWLNIAEYTISCYQHWSDDEDYKSASRYRHIATIFHHGVKALNYAAFFSLQCRFLSTFDYSSVVLLQLSLSLYLFISSIREYIGQKKTIQRMVERLPSIDCNGLSSIDKEDICLICRDHLVQKEFNGSTGAITVKQLTCVHQFHEPCLVGWLQRSMQCPTCRKAFEGRKD